VTASGVSAFPLQWPAGWPRAERQSCAAFHSGGKPLSVHEARQRLIAELDRLYARYATLSTNVELRLDGLPYSGQKEPTDPGAAAYFQLQGKDIALACDKWDRVADNIAAIAKHIEALRGMDRWGVGTARQAFAGYEALPAPEPWWQILGLTHPNATRAEIAIAYRRASNDAHPDKPGGSHDRMAAVNKARDEGLARSGI
jgi:hypothetical protein